MDPKVYRCPSCGAALSAVTRLVVRCRHCDCEVHLMRVEERRWAAQAEELQRRIDAGQSLDAALRPKVAEATEALRAALVAGRPEEAVLHFATLMRLETAGPQLMLPDVDYEAEVVLPAVRAFAAEHGVDLPRPRRSSTTDTP